MHYEYPIEQLVSSVEASSQLRFAARAAGLLPRRDDVIYQPSPEGLCIMAGDESALATPVEILQQAYGQAVAIGAPHVRLQRDSDGIKEPVMNVRVDVPAADAPGVIDDLRRRDALLQEVDERFRRAVIRAQAALGHMLGYRRALAMMTDDTVALWMWLSHYAAVRNGNG